MPKEEFASRDLHDVWVPVLAPGHALVKAALGEKDDRAWAAAMRRYRAEMQEPGASRTLDLLAARGAVLA